MSSEWISEYMYIYIYIDYILLIVCVVVEGPKCIVSFILVLESYLEPHLRGKSRSSHKHTAFCLTGATPVHLRLYSFWGFICPCTMVLCHHLHVTSIPCLYIRYIYMRWRHLMYVLVSSHLLLNKHQYSERFLKNFICSFYCYICLP